ncbi:hypothetical protein ACFXPI_27165 [Streptomyces sp. NPDC059104]|uniref:hypothetical protein n=1 Tax=Streptomyces sp. NPDC059104 TaxID=3346729 RepID=UPI0036936C28
MYVHDGPTGLGIRPSDWYAHPPQTYGHVQAAPAGPAAHAVYNDPQTPLYQMLVHEWQYLGRCSPECCRPGMAQIHHVFGQGRL